MSETNQKIDINKLQETVETLKKQFLDSSYEIVEKQAAGTFPDKEELKKQAFYEKQYKKFSTLYKELTKGQGTTKEELSDLLHSLKDVAFGVSKLQRKINE